MQDAYERDASHAPIEHICLNLGRLESVIEYIAEGIVILDEEGMICYANRSAERILALPRQALLGESYHDPRWTMTTVDGAPLPPSALPFTHTVTEHAVMQGVEIGITRGDGQRVLLAVTTVPLYDERQRFIGMVATFNDISARKETERALQRAYAELDDHVRQRTRELMQAVTDLETERSRQRTILDALPVGVAILDAHGALVEMNERLQDIWFGTAPRTPVTIMSPTDYTVFRAWWPGTNKRLQPEDWGITRALTHGDITTNEVLVIQRFDESCATILISTAPTRDHTGAITGAVAVVQDITATHELETRARETAATLFTMFDQAPLGVVLFDTHLRARQVNAMYARLVHREIAEIIGQPLRALLAIELFRREAAEAAYMIRRCLRTGEPYTGTEIPVPLKSDAATTRYIDWTVQRVESTHDDPLGVLVTMIDTTEHVRARQQVEFERARWLTALNTLPSAVVVVDRDGNIQVANPAAEQLWGGPLYGYSLDELLAQTQLLDPASGTPINREQQPLVRALRGQKVCAVEAVLLRRDGTRLPVFIHAAPVILEGRVAGAVQITQDISRLKEADRIKDEFLATVTHDLRAPLTAIQGWAQMAQEADDLALIHDALDAVLRSVQMQRMLVNDLLDASALATGTLSLEPEWQDIRPVLTNILTSFEPLAIQHGLTLQMELPPEPVRAYVDALRLQQIVGNLLGNALKFTPADGAITMRLSRRNSHVILTVTDTGVGIAPAVLPHIFERFYH